MKEITKVMYEAFDGTKFDTVTECCEYEKKHNEEAQKEKERIEKVKADIENLRKMALPHYMIPLCEHSLDPKSWWFTWFKVNNDEEAELLDEYVGYDSVSKLNYPAYICVESEYEFFQNVEKGNVGGEYAVTLDDCIKEVKWFFEQFGLEMALTKKGEQ